MTELGIVAAVISATALVLVAMVTGFWAYKNKRTPEPTPMEKLWARLDAQDAKISGLETFKSHAEEQIDTLTSHVKAFRGGFLAYTTAWARSKSAGTLQDFTPAESDAILRAQTVHDGHDLPF